MYSKICLSGLQTSLWRTLANLAKHTTQTIIIRILLPTARAYRWDMGLNDSLNRCTVPRSKSSRFSTLVRKIAHLQWSLTHSHLKRSQLSRFDPSFGSLTHGSPCLLRWLNCGTWEFASWDTKMTSRTHLASNIHHLDCFFTTGPTPHAAQDSKPTPHNFNILPFCLQGQGDSLISLCLLVYIRHPWVIS